MEGRKELVVVVVGATMCGKTKLIQRFAKNIFHEVSQELIDLSKLVLQGFLFQKYIQTGFDKLIVTHSVGDQAWNFTIWDTSGKF